MRLSNYLNKYLWTLYRLAERRTKFRLKAIFSCTYVLMAIHTVNHSLFRKTKKYTCKTISELILYIHSSICHSKKKKSQSKHDARSVQMTVFLSEWDSSVTACNIWPGSESSNSYAHGCKLQLGHHLSHMWKRVNASGTHFTWVIMGTGRPLEKHRSTKSIWLLEVNNVSSP